MRHGWSIKGTKAGSCKNVLLCFVASSRDKTVIGLEERGLFVVWWLSADLRLIDFGTTTNNKIARGDRKPLEEIYRKTKAQ